MSEYLIPIAHRMLENNRFYDAYQTCVGSVAYRKKLVRSLASPEILSFLDIGCGTASTVDLLPTGAEYHGIDISEEYLDRARSKRPGLNLFLGDVSKVTWTESINLKAPTTCIALGIFHHLNDLELDLMLENCLRVLPKGSQIFSMDPIVSESSSRGARWFAENDRGKYVRTFAQLEKVFLEKNLFPTIKVKSGQMRIPLDTVEISIRL
jgi:SAM-dependent methyltransferase